ncbi:UvrD-helicase domain-containing protein [Coprobacter fastidiosus]|uniref:DNA 3'-5' helicase n=1 Tax=Coprobacter fastidiosus NSB1 = JCM 33896 TaxID=1349822 RepID=A0A495WNF5_9BACT|nr:UvrD-helicase domain-containing protein [Coprobacter fastidiosus]ERM88250.1 helicase IV [Coprobacter fastidiosus NSB1 = JCM 33896]RKT61348.1 DNA helicase-4 [Coprobacter fastidiosus NSB1 = JCM 33896]BEG61420.1 UvrD-helicase domain-containing protein [Coprobacter fastidiosus]
MNLLLAIIVSAVVISVVIIATIRKRLKVKSNELLEQIKGLISYSDRSNYEQAKERLSAFNKETFIDIPTDLNNTFCGKIITATQEKDFINHYKPHFQEAYSLVKKLEAFNITLSETISKFINDFGVINKLVKQHNEGVITFLLDTHKDFFDHCLKYPLDQQQRRSIVSEEDNCLVVSSAGSGKTSSIIGKVKYLTDVKGIAPHRILLISYTNKAAAELTERMATDGLKGYTFHKLAIDIIGRATGIKPSICDNTDALFIDIYHTLLGNKAFKNSVVEYFIDYQTNETDWEKRKNERQEQLSEQKNVQLKAMFPDMDGRAIYVRSEQEQKICFVLSSLGVKFRYEEPYEHQLADEMHSQYRPDFSIYFEQKGVTKRIYLEHFGVDEHSLVPAWFAKDKNITYEEANQKYDDGITWKKAAHEKFGTQLLVTSSADFHYSDIRNKLKKILEDVGVPIQEKTNEELYGLILPKGSKQEKAFIRLVATFVTLVKSSCKSVKEVLKQAKNADDERSVFIIKNIFQPVYERYISALSDSNQIDFTDAILQATEICRASHPVEYDYIIVDEFQDISVDRYNFLKVLREGNPPAKLYCVGDDWQSIYRFSGSDMALFNQFPEYFGATEINKIETTYRFGEPLVSLSSYFIQRNKAQIQKDIHSFDSEMKTELEFYSYDRRDYCNMIGQLVASIPSDKSIFLLGRYSFDDYYLSFMYQSIKEGNRFFYVIGGRKIEFLTIHKSKGLEADYVILLQCNKDTYGFPSLVSDDPVLNYVLTKSDQFPYGEERRLFYVAITRAKMKTLVLYDKRFPSVFVDEFLHPEKLSEESYVKHPNANKRWTRSADQFLLKLHSEGKSVKYIAAKMGRSQTSIVMRLNKLNQ